VLRILREIMGREIMGGKNKLICVFGAAAIATAGKRPLMERWHRAWRTA